MPEMDEPVQTINVLYSCSLCGLRRVAVSVPARQEEDVVDWTTKVMAVCLGQDHAARSPRCHPEALSEVMIPITGADRVGGVAVS